MRFWFMIDGAGTSSPASVQNAVGPREIDGGASDAQRMHRRGRCSRVEAQNARRCGEADDALATTLGPASAAATPRPPCRWRRWFGGRVRRTQDRRRPRQG